MGIFVGTSGWSYPSWKPGFYPKTVPAKKFLEHYGTRLNSVEVNYTFRALPKPAQLEGWLGAVGEGFRFSFKAPQRITHFSRLKDCGGLVEEFYSALIPVRAAGKLGVVLFQLPPNFKADVGLLDAFLGIATGEGWRVAFEFRHSSWFVDEVFEAMRRYGVGLCVAESDELETPDVATAEFRCYRLRKSTYSEAELEELAGKFAEQSASGDVFVAFRHEEEPTGALNAAALLTRMRLLV